MAEDEIKRLDSIPNSEKRKIEVLNNLYIEKNEILIECVFDTIKFVLLLDKYIRTLNKAFKLNKRRKHLSREVMSNVLDKIK